MYSIGQIADMMGISPSAIRFYDRKGLMPFVKRDQAGRRKFQQQDLNFIEVINCLKRSGVPVKNIAHFIQLCMQGDQTLSERYDFIDNEEQQLTAQIKELQDHLDFLRFKKWYYKTAIEAGTEDVHFLDGTRQIDPQARAQYQAALARADNLEELISLT